MEALGCGGGSEKRDLGGGRAENNEEGLLGALREEEEEVLVLTLSSVYRRNHRRRLVVGGVVGQQRIHSKLATERAKGREIRTVQRGLESVRSASRFVLYNLKGPRESKGCRACGSRAARQAIPADDRTVMTTLSLMNVPDLFLVSACD
jgi:hypothetical protein